MYVIADSHDAVETKPGSNVKYPFAVSEPTSISAGPSVPDTSGSSTASLSIVRCAERLDARASGPGFRFAAAGSDGRFDAAIFAFQLGREGSGHTTDRCPRLSTKSLNNSRESHGL